jgi:hypothetical protein
MPVNSPFQILYVRVTRSGQSAVLRGIREPDEWSCRLTGPKNLFRSRVHPCHAL